MKGKTEATSGSDESLLICAQVVSLETKILVAEKEMLTESDSEKRSKLEKDIKEYRNNLATEKRAIMKDWLKTLFRSVPPFFTSSS